MGGVRGSLKGKYALERAGFLILALTLSLLTFGVAQAVAPPVRACFEIWTPYQFVDEQGRPKGVTLDVTRDILGELGYEVDFTALPYKRCVNMVRAGEMDMVISSGGEEGLVPAHVHKVDWVIGLFMSQDRAPAQFESLSEIGPLTVGYGQQFELPARLTSSPYLRLEPAPDDLLNFRKLASGRIDAVATDMPWAFGLPGRERLGAIYVPPALAIVPQPDAFRPGLEALRDAYSDALEAKRARGDLDRCYSELLGRSLTEIEATPLLPTKGFRE
ncbi:substrate-binding periplasmic protein [Rhodospirillum sp. A1_3_36]|uniref:substrate-binding periplasmic protein n=1 Tax=Rhodospirillum sp. A1_3_36 TaxID=3391666 RepID=UPI0039A7477B